MQASHVCILLANKTILPADIHVLSALDLCHQITTSSSRSAHFNELSMYSSVYCCLTVTRLDVQRGTGKEGKEPNGWGVWLTQITGSGRRSVFLDSGLQGFKI